MNRVFQKYFTCEDGHITVGDHDKKKCDAASWELQYEKGKRKGSWTGEKVKGKPCGKDVIKIDEIPEKLDMSTVWPFDVMHAFIIGQKFDASLMISFQEIYSKLHDRVKALEEKVYGKE